MGALYLKDLGDKTRRGLRGRVEKGLSGAGKSYGYRVVKKPRADGTIEPGHRETITEQAEIVCRIFSDYANGMSIHPHRSGPTRSMGYLPEEDRLCRVSETKFRNCLKHQRKFIISAKYHTLR